MPVSRWKKLKGRAVETGQTRGCQGCGREEQATRRGFRAVDLLCDAEMLHTSHHTFVQTHRLCNTE